MDQNIKAKNERRAIAAVDFGTSYSVFAYSWKFNWRQIQTNEWNSEFFYSSKASTSLILNPDQTFLAFGYEAELKYFKSNDDEEKTQKYPINDYYFFPSFKNLLYNQVSCVFNQILGYWLTLYVCCINLIFVKLVYIYNHSDIFFFA